MRKDTAVKIIEPIKIPDFDGDEPIDSVPTFLAQIVQRNKQLKGNGEGDVAIFYRGHAHKDWDLIPSILRDPKLVKKEHQLFRDMVAHEPQSFLECKSALDYLVQMQHYGLPTRLLDVTMNPLVALYLACKDAPDDEEAQVSAGIQAGAEAGRKDSLDFLKKSDADKIPEGTDVAILHLASRAGAVAGAVAALGISVETAKWASALSDVVFCDESGIEKDIVKRVVRGAAKAGAEAGAKAGAKARGQDGIVYLFSAPEKEVRHYDSDDVSVLANLAKCEISEECYSDSPDFSRQHDILSLIDQVQGEKSHFKSSITPDNLTSLFFVKAKNGNQRIANQMVAFLIFGLGLTSVDEGFKGSQYLRKTLYPKVPVAWIKEKFIIPRECKADILKELELLGITESYIYPGMEQYAKDLKKHYNIKG